MAPAIPALDRRILVVDDDEIIADVIARKARALGYTADVALDGRRAIALAGVNDYSVVLTDLVMPDLGGIELLSSLTERSDSATFILMTGESDLDAHDSRAVEGRLTTVLAKPFSDVELAHALQQAFAVADRRRQPAPQARVPIRVLLLEDSPSDAFIMKQSLRLLGDYEVTHVARLEQAVQLLHEQAFDTIITDLSLPDARGLGAVFKLRDCAPEATVIVCSGVADEVMALRVIELGVQDFIVKGEGDIETLGRAIRFARVRRQGERALARLAHTDGLTGLANRNAFNERFAQYLAQAKRQQSQLGLMYVDLDGFKEINDFHGHEAGDAVLREVAARLLRCVREYDVVARLGGDEFAILTTHSSGSALETVAQRITGSIALPMALPRPGSPTTVLLSASIGLSQYPDDGDDASLLLTAADEAMYQAKRSGKSRVCAAPGASPSPSPFRSSASR